MPGSGTRKNIEKVMLIFPTGKVYKGRFHHCELPLGIAYLASVLRGDFKVKVLDARAKFRTFIPENSIWEYYGYTEEEIIKEIEAFSPDVLGITCLFSYQFSQVVSIFRRIKSLTPEIVTVTGGSHPTFLCDKIMPEHPEIDYIILGEGERTFSELLNRLRRGEDYLALDGLAFRDKGGVRVNEKKNFIEDLDSLPFPAHDLLPMEFYHRNAVPFGVSFRNRRNAPVMTSRGCTSKCIFCASRNYWGNMYRERSPENVLDEIEMLVKKYGIKEIQFVDDNLTLNRKRAMSIFQGIIERKLKICWNTPNGIAVWTIDEEMLDLMKKSGCYELTIAFESGDQEVLSRIIKKPLNLEKAAGLVRKIQKKGILTFGYFICGFPDETPEQVMKTFQFARKVDLDGAGFFIANPTPGSELFDVCRQRGYIKGEFSFENIEYILPNFGTDHMSAEELEQLVLKNFNSFLFRVLIRHPVRFAKKYLLMFLAHPGMAFRTTWSDIDRILKRLWKRSQKHLIIRA